MTSKLDSNMVTVSVIIVTFNQQNYIRQCLDSVLGQKTSFRYEILIGDDCSTDSTPSIIREYEQKYPEIIRAFCRKEHVGPTKNVYDLCTKMQGDFFAYLEGDDYWFNQNKLQIQYDFLSIRKDLIGCFHDCNLVDDNGVIYKNKHLPWITKKSKMSYKSYDGIVLPGHSSTWFRRNIYLDPRFDYSALYNFHPSIGDRTAALIFLAHGNFEKVDGNMSCYRCINRDNSSITKQLYSTNASQLEYDLICKLENYSKSVIGKPKDFAKRKKQIFADAVVSYCRTKSTSDKALVKQIYADSTLKFCLIISLPLNIVKKIIKHIIK